MAELGDKEIEAFVRGTAALCAFGDQRVAPLLKANQNRTDYQEALTGTYYRMQLSMRSLAALPEPHHFQTLMSTARALYELLLDLKLLKAAPSDVEKYHDFAFVSRFSAAKKYADAVNEFPAALLPTKRTDFRLSYVTNPPNEKHFDDIREKHWGRSAKGNLVTPEHWSGMSMPDRARRLSAEEYLRCRSVYSQYCWFVHSGSAGTAGISREGLVAGFGWGLATALTYFTEAIEIICTEEKLFDAHEGLRHEFDVARVEMGRVYEQIRDIAKA
jgi:hypothetical protein